MSTQISKRSSSLRRATLALALLGGASLATGCVTDGNTYSRYESGAVYETLTGRLIGVEPISINGTNSGVGAASGAALGGVLGSQIGRDRGFRRGYRSGGSVAGAVGFAILGGLVGAAIEDGATGGSGFRYTIELEDGREISVVQRDKNPVAPLGSDVRVEYGRTTRVLPA